MTNRYIVQKNNTILSISEEYLNKKDIFDPIEVAKILEAKLFNPIAKVINDANKETAPFSEFTLKKIEEQLPCRQNSGYKHFVYLGHYLNGLSCYIYSNLKDDTYYAEIAYEEGIFFPNNPAKDKYSTIELINDSFELIVKRNDEGVIEIDGLDRARDVFIECFSRHLKTNTYPLRFREYRVKPSYLPNSKGMKITFNTDKVTKSVPFCRSEDNLFKEFTSPKGDMKSERFHLCVYNLINYIGSRYDTNGDSFLVSGVVIDGLYYYHLCNRKGDFERLIPFNDLVSTISQTDEHHPKAIFKAIVEYCENIAEYKKQDFTIFLTRFVRFVLHFYSSYSTIRTDHRCTIQTRVLHSSTLEDKNLTPGFYFEYVDLSNIKLNDKRFNLLLSDKEAEGFMSEDIITVIDALLNEKLVSEMHKRVLSEIDDFQRSIYNKLEKENTLRRNKVKKAIGGYLLKLVNKYQIKYSHKPAVIDYLNSFYTTEYSVGFGKGIGVNIVNIDNACNRDDFTGEIIGSNVVCSMNIGGEAFYSDYSNAVPDVIEGSSLGHLLEIWMDICCRCMLKNVDITQYRDDDIVLVNRSNRRPSINGNDDVVTVTSFINSIHLVFSRDDFALCEYSDIEEYISEYRKYKTLPYHFFINLNIIDKEDDNRVKTYTLPLNTKRISLEEDILSRGEVLIESIVNALVDADNEKEAMIKAYDIIDTYNRSEVETDNGNCMKPDEYYRYS